MYEDNCDIYVHTYDTKFANAPRSGEKNIPIDIEDIKLLGNCKKVKIDSEKDVNNNSIFKEVHKYGDIFKNNFNSTDNLIRELYSIKCCYNLIENIDQYDMILMTRADLEFCNKIAFRKVEDDEIFIGEIPSNIKSNLPKEVHDFFAYGGKDAIKKWANRFDDILDFCRVKGSLHAEPLVWYIIETKNIKLNILNEPHPLRVRACGKKV